MNKYFSNQMMFQNNMMNNNNFINNQNMQNNNMFLVYNMLLNNLKNNSQQNNNNINSKDSNSNTTPLKELKNMPMIGLKNIGQTCYMNSVLQCFSNLFYITDYFLNPSKKDIIDLTKINSNSDKKTLSMAYRDLLTELWKGKPNISISPYEFKNILGELNPLFKDKNASDSKDLACYLIMQLHTELNLLDPSLNKNEGITTNPDNVIVNHYDSKQVLNYFLNDFLMNQNSIITQYFYGFNQGMFECQNCKMNKNMIKGVNTGNIKYNYENFFYLEFPLDEVRKYVMSTNNYIAINMGMNYQNIKEVNLYDCFNYYQAQNVIVGYCEKCGLDNAKITMKNQIYSPPNILMIVFNRGQGLQYNIKINFDELLDLRKIIMNNNQIYELQSVIKHLGDNSASGHFIAYCRSPLPNCHNLWFCYNDETVVQVNNWKDITETGVTYILFYQLKTNN